MKKKALLLLKILLSVVLLYLLFLKIPFSAVTQTLIKAQGGYIILAVFFFLWSKIIAAYRLQGFWRVIQVHISNTYNLKLYLQGMFYNLFLPGGIGGDAYKGYVVKKAFSTPTKKIFGVLLLDRLSGILLLGILSCLMVIFPVHPALTPYIWWCVGAIPFAILVFYWGVKQIYPYALVVFWSSFIKSAGVQIFQLVAVYFIASALGLNQELGRYLLVFLISSIVAVIPLTIGGIGSRELTFLYGAKWFGLDYNSAIAMSLLFFIITALVSFFGLFYHLKKPKLIQVH